MTKLHIYDSQGNPIGQESDETSDTIKDLFFDGVRFAIDKNKKQMYCFFRAKDSGTARSEQYYAMYTYTSRSELNNLVTAVRNRVENDYDMTLDNEKEDTGFFQALSEISAGKRFGDKSTRDDIAELLTEHHQVRLGVGQYEEAYALFSELFNTDGVSTFAVSNNASGQSVSAYDLVIEIGSYTGLEMLGETAEAVEELREHGKNFSSDHPSGSSGESGGTSYSSSSTQREYESMGSIDSDKTFTTLELAILIASVGILVIVTITYGGCFVGIEPPAIGVPPGMKACSGI